MIKKPTTTKRVRIIGGEKSVDFRVSLGSHAGKPLVFFRKTKPDAQAHGEDLYKRYSKLGDTALTLTSGELADAASAFQILKGHAASVTLADAVRYYVTHHTKDNGVTFGQLLDAYLGGLSSDLSGVYVRTTRHYVKRFAEILGRDMQCSALTPSNVKAVLDELGGTSAKSHNNVRAALHTIFVWGMGAGLLQSNPVAGVAKRKALYKPPVFFNSEQVAAILNEGAQSNEAALYMPWLVLGFFCGLRSAEIARLDWEAVKWEDAIVRIETPKGFTRGVKPRFVTLNETARAWLTWYKQDGGTFADYAGFCRWRKTLTSYPVNADNAMRHTFATMHFALHGDLQKTAAEMGHYENVRTTLEHYRGLTPERDAKAFWSLRPRFTVEPPQLETAKTFDFFNLPNCSPTPPLLMVGSM